MGKHWTPKEHIVLQKAYHVFKLSGESWSAKAAEALPGRTAAACETRYGYLKSFGLKDVISKQLSLTEYIEKEEKPPYPDVTVSNKSSVALCQQIYKVFECACELLGVPIETIQRDC